EFRILILTDRMFNRTTSTKFFAPRRQARKEKNIAIFSELGVLCASSRLSDSQNTNSRENFKHVWLEFRLLIMVRGLKESEPDGLE
ncbi:MAG: hypothetical protein VST67_02450, partial [Nitrospirota bacterium]|nr:hypothetical protein [Nitrospirota bacterium]